MTAKTNIVKSKIMKIYDLDDYEKLTKGIRVATCMLTESHQVVDEESVMRRLKALTLDGPSDGNCCSCCGVGPFETRAQQIAHYKHHWHTHNLKRKLFGKPPLSLGQFNSRQQDDDSSVSGSESEGEDTSKNPASDLFAAATRHCKAFFTNPKGQVFCIYRCVLHHKKEELSTDGNGEAWVERVQKLAIPGFQRWAVLMISGGHFAGAIFSGGVPVVHKTHHAYVSRKGQGQCQVNRDQHGNMPRSAGANLRRYNQKHFLENVHDIICSWYEDLKGCSLVLYRAVGSLNQSALFGKNSPLNREDLIARALPFPTRKPSYKEVKRVLETVASVEVYETMELFQKALIASTTKSAPKTASDSSVNSNKKPKSPQKIFDRAKSRERAPRELPTQLVSSEDEGPCYIDSETPVGWIKTLSEQSNNGMITNSRKDLINDCDIANDASSESEMDGGVVDTEEKGQEITKKKRKEPKPVVPEKRGPQKIPASVKKMWKVILDNKQNSLETIFEGWEEEDLQSACNTQDPTDGNTALHKAAIASKPEMVTQILNAGGDPCIRNNLLQTPYAASPHHDTRIAFRMFQAQFPDKYNYTKSQIPGPVTPEILEQEKERKAQQRRAKRQREKVKQVEKTKTNKFLQMTDGEKVQTKELRCFLCGAQLPKKPFEYEAYKFCSVRCLQNHRNIRPLALSV